MSAVRASSRSSQREGEAYDSPPPYTLHPANGLTLEVGPNRPFQPPPQQPPQRHVQVLQRQNRESRPSAELSDFARDFYTAGDRPSRSAESLPRPPPLPPRHPQSQHPIPDDGRPTRTPVPGHPLLNNGRTLVYPDGYECDKCACAFRPPNLVLMIKHPGRNTGYRSYDPSNPCRKCWEKYSKPYSGPIIYSSWGPGPSNRQRPLLNLRPGVRDHSRSLSQSVNSLVNQVRDDLSSLASYPGNSARYSFPPSSPQVYPPRNISAPPPSSPCRRPDYISTSVDSGMSSTWPRSAPPPPVVLRPGDPRIGGQPCHNCFGSGRTFGFLLLSERTCSACGGTGRLF